jgi:C1A family cysteine protease
MPSKSKKNLKIPSDTLLSSHILENLNCKPKIKNQGQLNSCTAVALAGMLETIECRDFDKYTEVSSLFIYKLSRNLLRLTGDTGATIKSTMAVHKLFGIPPEKNWPYTDNLGDVIHYGYKNEPPAFCYAIAKNYGRLNKAAIKIDLPKTSKNLLLERIKKILAENIPLYMTFKLFGSQLNVKSNKIIYPCPSDEVIKEIQVKAIGYNDNKKIKNPKCNIKNKGAILFDGSPKISHVLLPYDYVLNGHVKDCLLPLKEDLISLDEFILEGYGNRIRTSVGRFNHVI